MPFFYQRQAAQMTWNTIFAMILAFGAACTPNPVFAVMMAAVMLFITWTNSGDVFEPEKIIPVFELRQGLGFATSLAAVANSVFMGVRLHQDIWIVAGFVMFIVATLNLVDAMRSRVVTEMVDA